MTQRDSPFLGKVAAITGGAAGNGFAAAARIGREGGRIFISDINAAALEDALINFKSQGIDAAGGVFDASKPGDAYRFFGAVVQQFGRLDVFVNNAGAIRPQPFLEVTEETWDWTMSLNLRGAYFYMQEAAKLMIAQAHGPVPDHGSSPKPSRAIINISSISGLQGGATLSPPYAASKAALINLTQIAAIKLAPYGITVNAVAPGMVNTDFNRKIDEEIGQKKLGMEPGKHWESRWKPVPLGRPAEPEDIANAVAFLARSESNYITGETIVVAGGLVMH